MDFEYEIEKLKFQLNELISTLDFERSALPIFIIEQNWGENEWDEMADVLDRYDSMLINGENFEKGNFERDLRDAVGLSYQGVKALISSLFYSDRWTNVCYRYAKAFEPNVPIEMKRIIEFYDA